MLRGLRELALRRAPKGHSREGGNPLTAKWMPGQARHDVQGGTYAYGRWCSGRQLLEETPQDGLTSCQVRNVTYP